MSPTPPPRPDAPAQPVRADTVTPAPAPDDRTERIAVRWSLAYLDAIAGRPITADEADRIARAVAHSSIPDALCEVIAQVCGYPHHPDPLAPSDDCDDRCVPHASSCDGHCDHIDHRNACQPSTARACGTELARQYPVSGAAVVVTAARHGGDVRNAWEVLVSAHGPKQARLLVLAQDGGAQALRLLGEAR